LPWRRVVKALGRGGFKLVHQKGSHMYLTDGEHRVTVPRHAVIRKGTLRSIIQQAGLTKKEFLTLLEK
jgi:predicted RNA binding protein YcfA (HicA-like mRNA interferase family)